MVELRKKNKGRVIAIDGPAGSGKSTVARLTAKKIGFLYIDTGALYRAITLKAVEQKIDFSHIKELIKLVRNSSIDLKENSKGRLKVLLDGRDVTQKIRIPYVNRFVSCLAKVRGVRRALLPLQRNFAQKNNIVLEGRDIGTVVFPEAEKKFYLDASLKERIRRRLKELKESFPKITYEEVKKDLTNRDHIDSTRRTAPLKKAQDAIYIDTTDMTIEEVVNTILKEINKNAPRTYS